MLLNELRNVNKPMVINQITSFVDTHFTDPNVEELFRSMNIELHDITPEELEQTLFQMDGLQLSRLQSSLSKMGGY